MEETFVTYFIRTYVGFFVSGILIGVSFIVPFLWWCSLPGIALFAYAVETALTKKQAMRGAFIAGFLKSLLAAVWLLSAYPFDWLTSAPHSTQLLVDVLCWLGTGVSMGAGYIALVWVRKLQRFPWYQRSIFFGALLVLAENIGAFLYSLYSYGPGISLNSDFGYGMVGFSLAYHGILKYIAIFGGVYALSAALGCIGYATRILFSKQKSYAVAVSVLFLLTGYLTLPFFHDTNPIHVATISTSFPSFRTQTFDALKNDRAVMLSGVRTALSAGAQTVALPEDERFGFVDDIGALLTELHAIPHTPGAIVVDSYRTKITDDTAVLRGYIYDIDTREIYTSDKQLMVAMGEYVPYLYSFFAESISHSIAFAYMQYVEGKMEISADAPPRIPEILFCSEDAAGLLAKEKVANRAPDLIVHPVSHVWFHTPRTLWNEERQMLIVQSLFTQTPILQAGNGAPSLLFTPDGRVNAGKVIEQKQEYAVTMFDRIP